MGESLFKCPNLFIPGAAIGYILGNGISYLLKMAGVNGVSAEAVAFVMGAFTAFYGKYLYFKASYEATKVGGIVSVFIKVLIIAIIICAGIIFVNSELRR